MSKTDGDSKTEQYFLIDNREEKHLSLTEYIDYVMNQKEEEDSEILNTVLKKTVGISSFMVKIIIAVSVIILSKLKHRIFLLQQ